MTRESVGLSSSTPDSPMNGIMVRRWLAGFLLAAASIGLPLVGAANPASASDSAPRTDPVTMGSVQLVNAFSDPIPVTLSVGGRVRARGVPRGAWTAPIVVAGGTQRISVSVATNSNQAAGSAGGPDLTVDVAPGARRTVFLSGSVQSPTVVVVDAPTTKATSKKRTTSIVDLRSPARRTPFNVDGTATKVDVNGRSAMFAVGETTSISFAVTAPDVNVDMPAGASVLFVADTATGPMVAAVGHNLVGLDSLRTPIVVVKDHTSPIRLYGALAVMVSATVGAISSMMVFRTRTRDDRVRGLMAKSFGF